MSLKPEDLDDLPDGDWTHRQKQIAGVRALLDFLETHDDVPWPSGLSYPYTFVDTKEQMATIVRALGNVSKFPSGDHFEVNKRFGEFTTLVVYVPREEVCRKVVKGVEHIEEKVTPAHDREVVEWVCDDPLLKPSNDDYAQVYSDGMPEDDFA